MNENVSTTNITQPEPVTLESMMQAIEDLCRTFPDLGKHFCSEFITVQDYFPSQQGTRHMCTHCHKLYVIPDHFIQVGEVKS